MCVRDCIHVNDLARERLRPVSETAIQAGSAASRRALVSWCRPRNQTRHRPRSGLMLAKANMTGWVPRPIQTMSGAATLIRAHFDILVAQLDP